MGMFDWYQPDPPITCPVCHKALAEWQGKDGPCGLFLWRQNVATAVDQLADDDCKLDEGRREVFRLPEKFMIYSYSCDCGHAVEAVCRCENGSWTSTVLVPASHTPSRRI